MKCCMSSLRYPHVGHLVLLTHLKCSRYAFSGMCPVLIWNMWLALDLLSSSALICLMNLKEGDVNLKAANFLALVEASHSSFHLALSFSFLFCLKANLFSFSSFLRNTESCLLLDMSLSATFFVLQLEPPFLFCFLYLPVM